MTVAALFEQLAERGASLKRPRREGRAGWAVNIVCEPLAIDEAVAGVDPEDCVHTALRLLDRRAHATAQLDGVELGGDA